MTYLLMQTRNGQLVACLSSEASMLVNLHVTPPSSQRISPVQEKQMLLARDLVVGALQTFVDVLVGLCAAP